MTLYSFPFFNVCKIYICYDCYWEILWSSCLLLFQQAGIRTCLFPHWLPINVLENSLLYYFTHSLRREEMNSDFSPMALFNWNSVYQCHFLNSEMLVCIQLLNSRHLPICLEMFYLVLCFPKIQTSNSVIVALGLRKA